MMSVVRRVLLPSLLLLGVTCGCGDMEGDGLQPEGASADIVGEWERLEGAYTQQLTVDNGLRGRWLVRDASQVLDTEDYRYWINGNGLLISQYEVTLVSFCGEAEECRELELPNRQTGTYFANGHVFNPEAYLRQGEGLSKTGVYKATFRVEAIINGELWLTHKAEATLMLGRDGRWRNEVDQEIFVNVRFDDERLTPEVLRSPRRSEQVWSGHWRDNGDATLSLFHTPVDGKSQVSTLYWRPGVASFRPFYLRPE